MRAARAVVGYTLVKPPPWVRIDLGGDVRAQVRSLVDEAARAAPKELSPDELAPLKAQLTHRLETRLAGARDGGGLDYYFPATELHGVQLNASFLVSTVLPGASLEADLSTQVLAELAAGGASRVSIAGHEWARTEEVVGTEQDELTDDGVRARRVDYTCPIPGDEQLWVLVSFSTLGDGDPDSELTALVVDLFDAIMTTWRWRGPAPEPGSGASAGTGS